MKYLCIALFAFSTTLASSQSKSKFEVAIASTSAAQVANLSKRFGELLQPTPVEQQLAEACMRDCAAAGSQVREGAARAKTKRAKAMNDVASQIHNQIDEYVRLAVQPSNVNPTSLAKDLKRILGDAIDGIPSVFVLANAHAPALIVGYTLLEGTLMGAESVTVRAYTPEHNAFRLVAATGEDMGGYVGVSFVKLHAPVQDDFWLLLSGQASGANGPNNRMRLYAYDGSEFRTLWAPANAWGDFSVRVTDQGFTVDGAYYRENEQRHEVYFAAADGLYRVFPTKP